MLFFKILYPCSLSCVRNSDIQMISLH